jgi:hypothetical protein
VFHGQPFTVGRVSRADREVDPSPRCLRDIVFYHISSILALSYLAGLG